MDRLQGLLEQFRRDRSAPAMEEIVRATRPRLLAAARRIGAREDAEDPVQAAYHALLARPEAPSVAVLPWLLAAVVRIAYRRKAIARRETRIAERLARPATPLEEASRAEIAALVRREVARLPARYRDPVVLYHLECLSVSEVARLLDVPASTVTTRLQRARLLLRARLSPALLHSVMVVPWFLWDSLAVPVGGVMKAKTAVVVAGVALATGAAGFGAGLAQRSEPEVATRATREVADLRRLVAELEGVEGGLGGEGRREAPAPPAPDATGPGLGLRPPPAGGPEVAMAPLWASKHVLDLEKAKAAAARLGVREDALAAAHNAYLCLANQADPKTTSEALAALEALGVDRTVAVAALLQGVEGGPLGTGWLHRLLEAARVEGQEHHVVGILKDATSPPWIKGAIVDNADALDSPVVRDYLVERLGLEEDKYMWASIAMTLGRMREPRAVPPCAEALRRGGDWEPFEVYALSGLQDGGREAEAALLAYVDGPAPRYLAHGLRALATIDAASARVRAEALLGDATREFGEGDRKTLLEVAGRAPR